MEWVEEKKIQGEEAAQLIAALPKTIRMPTNALLRRFYVSRNYFHKVFMINKKNFYFSTLPPAHKSRNNKMSTQLL